MKIKILLSLLIIGVCFMGCAEKKNSNTVSGVVQDVQNGKDGYTAQIKTVGDEVYYATISHTNLTDHSQYRSVAVGETIKVEGDQWDMEGKKQITVRKLYPTD